MRNKVFNTTFELSLRALLLLSISGESTVDRLVALDLICTYGNNFDVSNYNLHGVNDFSFGELTSRREKMFEAIKQLAFDSLIDVINSPEGFAYKINANGQKVCESMSTSYADEYKRVARNACAKYKEKSDLDLMKMIIQKASDTLEWRQE